MEHLIGVIKRQLGFTKVECKGVAKNMAKVVTRVALNNLWMARKALMKPARAQA